MSILRRSNFDKKLKQTLGVISAEKKESGVISEEKKEMNNVQLEQKEIMTPIKTIGRNFDSLLENTKEIFENTKQPSVRNFNSLLDTTKQTSGRNFNSLLENHQENKYNRYDEKIEEKIEEKDEQKLEMNEENFPSLMMCPTKDNIEEKKIKWNMTIDIDNFKKIANDINNDTIKRINEDNINKKIIER